MGELLIKEDGRYKEYEGLLLERDQFMKEACSIHVSYVKEFGELLLESFELKVDCIKKRKMIAFCLAAVNHGKPVDVKAMNEHIETEMAAYTTQLKDMAEDKKKADEAKVCPEYKAKKCKRIYHRLAKIIHPDINPKAAENEKIAELWNRVAIAYQCNDDVELDNLEILIRKVLKDNGDLVAGVTIDNIDERIDRLKEEINEIITTEPYSWKKILSSDKKTAELKEDIRKEIEDYKKISEDLAKVLQDILSGGGVPLTWIQE